MVTLRTRGSILVWSAPATAVPLVGSSSGTFSNLGGYDKAARPRMRHRRQQPGQQDPGALAYLDDGERIFGSSLTAIDIAINTATDAEDLLIGRLDWYNGATDGAATPDDFHGARPHRLT
jgi:hypothetical protein